MRPLVALALIVLLTVAPADAAPRTVLVESFGALDCPECADVRSAVDGVDTGAADGVVSVEYHASGPLQAPGVADRRAAYGAPSLPTTFFDGQDPVAGGGDVGGLFSDRVDAARAVATPLLFDAVATFSAATLSGSLNVELELDADLADTPDEWVLRGAFVEDDVFECCGSGGTDRWNRVVRVLLPPRAITLRNTGDIQFEQWDLPIDPFWEVTRLSSIVWVQRDSDRAVLGASLAADGGGLQPVPVIGLDLSQVNLLVSQPHPLGSGRTRIPFTLPAATHVRLTIHDVAGRFVRLLTDERRNEGVQDVQWTGIDFNGRPVISGVYFVRLETDTVVRTRKLVVVRD